MDASSAESGHHHDAVAGGAEAQRRLFRDAFAQWPTGVALISTVSARGPVGMTGTAVSSLSLDPLLVMVSLDLRSSTLGHIREAKSFGINFLRREDRAIAVACSGALSAEHRFVGVPHSLRNGVPVLDDALAWISCDLHETYPGGDHLIVIGHVTGIGKTLGEPLVWHDGRYRSL